MKPLIILFLFLFPFLMFSQTLKITEFGVKEIIDQMEEYPVEIIKVKTIKKWKALELSSDMKSQMDYNVVWVKYKTQDDLRIVIIDMHLVPIRLNSTALNE